MTSENSDPPDKSAAPVSATNSANNSKSQRDDGATDNDVIIVKTLAGLALMFIFAFKDEIKNGIKDLFRRLKKAGPIEFYPSPEEDSSKK